MFAALATTELGTEKWTLEGECLRQSLCKVSTTTLGNYCSPLGHTHLKTTMYRFTKITVAFPGLSFHFPSVLWPVRAGWGWVCLTTGALIVTSAKFEAQESIQATTTCTTTRLLVSHHPPAPNFFQQHAASLFLYLHMISIVLQNLVLLGC